MNRWAVSYDETEFDLVVVITFQDAAGQTQWTETERFPKTAVGYDEAFEFATEYAFERARHIRRTSWVQAKRLMKASKDELFKVRVDGRLYSGDSDKLRLGKSDLGRQADKDDPPPGGAAE